ncbi:MAG: DUF4097 family beta strand repeat-containing protein [bacterium]
MIRHLKLSVSAILILLLFASANLYAKEYSFDFQRIYSDIQPQKLELIIPRGKVIIVGSEDNRVVIDAVKYIRAGDADEAQDVADHIEIKASEDGKLIRIETNYLRYHGRGVKFWQKLLGGGSDTYGEVNYTIAVPTNIDLYINGIAADIELSSVQGDIEIENENGNTKSEFIFGDVTIKQPTGRIDLQWIEGDIRIKTASAKIDVNQVRGALDITSQTGDIYVRTELDSPRDYFVRTNSGSINFSIPEMSSGRLNIETVAGDINTEIPISIESVSNYKVVGEFGRGGPEINISSSTGNVRVALF